MAQNPLGIPNGSYWSQVKDRYIHVDGREWNKYGDQVVFTLDREPVRLPLDDVMRLTQSLNKQQTTPAEGTFWSQTYSGNAFYYDDDKIATNPYSLEDIAHQTAMICRYGGACKYHYSVAQHQVAVAEAIWQETHDPFKALDALFHDSEEGYTGDMRTPIKDRCPEFRKVTKPINAAIRVWANKIGIPVPMDESDMVRVFDRRIVADEKAIVMKPCKMGDWYGMHGFEPLGLSPTMFRKMEPEEAKAIWLAAVDAFTSIARHRLGANG